MREVSCEPSEQEMIHMNCQALFYPNKRYLKIAFANMYIWMELKQLKQYSASI